jgi:hypothetical protein
MFDELQNQFSTDAGRVAFIEQICTLIRAQEFEQCEAILMGGLSVTDSPIREAALATPLYTCALHGWPEFMKWVSLALEADAPVTALGCGLQYEGISGQIPGVPMEPHFDAFWFTDRKFPFSRMPIAELQELSADRGASWNSYIEDVSRKVRITGLDALFGHIWPGVECSPFAPDGAVPTADAVAWQLACLLMGQRIHQLIYQAMEVDGSIHQLPLLYVGTPMMAIPESAYSASKIYEVPVEMTMSPAMAMPFDNSTYQPVQQNGGHSLRHKIMAQPDAVESAAPMAEPAGGKGGFFSRLLKRA